MEPLILANIKGHLERAMVELYFAHAEVAFDDTDAKNADVALTLAFARSLVESVRTLLSGSSEAASNSSLGCLRRSAMNRRYGIEEGGGAKFTFSCGSHVPKITFTNNVLDRLLRDPGYMRSKYS
jgi:hypothetical protein